MNNPPFSTAELPSQESLKQRTRFGTRELLTAMLLCSIAFASQLVVGWKASFCMACAAIAIIMGWSSLALVGSCAALIVACFQPNAGTAASVCLAVLMTIAFGPLAVHKLYKGLAARSCAAKIAANVRVPIPTRRASFEAALVALFRVALAVPVFLFSKSVAYKTKQ